MLISKEEGLARYIELMVTYGRGYDAQTKFLSGKFEKVFCTEKEIRKTQEGLDAHLAEINLARDSVNIYHKYNGKFFGELRKRIGLSRVLMRNSGLKSKAVNSVLKSNLKEWPKNVVPTGIFYMNITPDYNE